MDLARVFESYKEYLKTSNSWPSFAEYVYSLRSDTPVEKVFEQRMLWGICEQQAYEFLKESE